jgi:hypothetical protein
MIKFESNTLVLNSIFSKEDVAEIDAFADYIRNAEQERIIKLLLETPEGRDAVELALHPSDEGSTLIALIKGDNK